MEVETTFTGFADRAEGGRRLAAELRHYERKPDTIVIGLPRGGVVTAAALARELALPLDVLVVRNLGSPRHEDLVMGAIGPGGVCVLKQDIVSLMRIDDAAIQEAVRRERPELERRERAWRGDRAKLDLTGKTVLLVDDGLTTGSTMATAIAVIRRLGPARVVVAVPVAPVETVVRFRSSIDELVYLETPDPLRTVGDWYLDFGPVDDAEITGALARSLMPPETI
jgi:predicted phosphoribosyltransferase